MGELIGRSSEVDLIKSQIKKMQSFHIYGPEGAGKTAILKHIYDNWNDLHAPLIPIFCKDSKTFKEILLPIAGFLLQRSRSLQNIDKYKRIKEICRLSDLKDVNSRDLKNVIFNNIGHKKFCIILDHLECVTPKINAFITPLKDRAVTITASRQSWEIADYRFSARLDYCLWLLPKVKIEDLSRQDSFLLMKNIAGYSTRENENLFAEVYQVTKGNARLIKKAIGKTLLPEYHIDGHINLKLIMLDIEIDRVKKARR